MEHNDSSEPTPQSLCCLMRSLCFCVLYCSVALCKIARPQTNDDNESIDHRSVFVHGSGKTNTITEVSKKKMKNLCFGIFRFFFGGSDQQLVHSQSTKGGSCLTQIIVTSICTCTLIHLFPVNLIPPLSPEKLCANTKRKLNPTLK